MSATQHATENANGSTELTQVLLAGLMEAISDFADAARMTWDGESLVLQLDPDRFVVIGPDDPERDEVDKWISATRGHWLVDRFVSVGQTLITYLVRN